MQDDLLLRKYSVVIVDEAHERNLNTDMLIGARRAACAALRVDVVTRARRFGWMW